MKKCITKNIIKIKKAASGYTIYNWGTLQIFIDAFN